MGIAGAVTSAVSSTSVTLPDSKLTIIGADAYAATASGYLSIPIDATKNALFPFTPKTGVTTTDVPVANVGPWQFVLPTNGLTLNYTGVGLTSGTFVFYYGTPFPNSLPYQNFSAITVAYTTSTSLSFTFPSGNIKLTGASNVFSTGTAGTGTYIQDSFNTSAGRSVTLNFSVDQFVGVQNRPMLLLDNLVAAQTLTVTQAYSTAIAGTGSGYLVLYYQTS